MKRPYQVTAIVCLLLAALVARESLQIKYYTSLGPGPGFFPLWLSIVLAALGAAMLWQATMQQSEPMATDFVPTRDGAVRVTAIVIALAAAAALIDRLGFRLTMLSFSLAMMLILGQRGWIEMVLVAVAASFGIHYVFVRYLGIPLPLGVLGI